MADLPNGFQVGELYCFALGSDGSASFAYIPGPPRIEVQAGGRPAVGLLSSPATTTLSTQTVWSADADALAATERGINERYPSLSAPTLAMGELTDATATLTVTPVGGAPHAFGPQPTSGAEPHRAVFSESLSADERDAATRGLQGQAGRVTITYQARLVLQETLTVQIAGDLAADLNALAPKPPEVKKRGLFDRGPHPAPPPPPPPDEAACVARVDAALAEGRLALTTNASPNVPPELRNRVEQAARTSVARYLLEQLEALGFDAQYMSSLQVRKASSGVEDVSYPIERTVDVGAWFAGYRGPTVITSTDQ